MNKLVFYIDEKNSKEIKIVLAIKNLDSLKLLSFSQDEKGGYRISLLGTREDLNQLNKDLSDYMLCSLREYN